MRYARQTMMKEIGEEGQQKLLNSKVLIVGVGGLGSILSQYLIRAGIGMLGLVDFDSIEISNIQRQILFDEEDVGESKLDTTINKLKKINKNCTLEKFDTDVSKLDIHKISKYDVICDCTDNMNARKMIDNICKSLKKKCVFGAVQNFEGMISVFDGQINGSSYLTFLGNKDPNDEFKDKGIIGPLPGIIGSFQALETIKILLNIPTNLSKKVLFIDGLESEIITIKL